eukprot:2725265-Amphidinium_carterae.1
MTDFSGQRANTVNSEAASHNGSNESLHEQISSEDLEARRVQAVQHGNAQVAKCTKKHFDKKNIGSKCITIIATEML